jgi:glycosyltransferase involved in cell wall biosynthesis
MLTVRPGPGNRSALTFGNTADNDCPRRDTPVTDDPTPLLVFADDWGRHPSSAQHLVRRLLPRRPVTWVNTIGTRPPRLDLLTLRRGLEKLRHWARPRPGPIADTGLSPTVLSPRMWPWQSSRLDRAVNRRLLERQLRPVIDAMPRPPVAVTTVPVVADLVGRLPVARWVYYCVDDFSLWPGLDGDALRRLERVLIERCDDAIAVSETLADRLAGAGRPARLLTHGVDLDFWKRSGLPSRPPHAIECLPRPRITFWGVIDRRMDVDVIDRLARAAAPGTVLLVGPRDNPDPALFRRPSVTALPAVPFETLPAFAAASDVLVMPYADLPVTRAIQPLKLKEYLATGLPVVARDLPATRDWADCLDLAATPEQFADAARRRLTEGVTASQRAARAARLPAEGWDAKADVFEEVCCPGESAACETEELVHV